MNPEIFETHIWCPYCGERLSILVDTSDSGSEYIEDCQVCCRPIVMNVALDGSGVNVRSENE
ncbi:MAG: CPXCG motif-containing cysteine-rich protein [Pseudomonadales bacterium]|nr:CPXCG motif-containing cysteine-rich protein [Pseudomonadales bacterium]